MDFTVEVTTSPVVADDWSHLRSVLDAVPGSALIEDPEEPILFIPVEADEPMRAAMFVDGLAKLTGLSLQTGSIYPTPVDDELEDYFDEDDSEEPPNDVVRALDTYASNKPVFDGRLTADGRLVNC